MKKYFLVLMCVVTTCLLSGCPSGGDDDKQFASTKDSQKDRRSFSDAHSTLKCNLVK